MPRTATGVNNGSFGNAIICPSNGEDVTSESVLLVAQSAADQDKRLQDTKGNLAGGNTWTGTQAITGAATVSTTLGISGNTTVGGTLGVTGNTSVGGTFGVTGTSTFGGNATASGAHGIALDGTAPTPTADPGANNIAIGALQCKAWGSLTLGSTVAVNDGINLATVTTGTVLCTVTFARPMANNNYSITFGNYVAADVPIIVGKVSTGFTFSVYKTLDFVTTWDLTAGTHLIDFSVFGRQ